MKFRPLVVLILAWSAWGGCTKSGAPPKPLGTTVSNSGGAANRTKLPGISHVSAARFADKTAGSAVDFTYRNGETADVFSLVEQLGGGVALFDYDADGRLDLLFPGGGIIKRGETLRGRPPALFRNLGDWKFENVTAAAGLSHAPFYSHGANVGDYDSDGFPDVLITGYGGLLLFHNQGDGTFERREHSAGLTDRQWSSSAAWGDVNGDGFLDLYVAHYVNWSWKNNPMCRSGGKQDVCGPRLFEGLDDILYFSNGDGTFRDASRSFGLKPGGKGVGVVLGDINLDGRLDVYVANDQVPNFLYRNDGSGRSEEVGLISGSSLNDRGGSDGSMGIDLADFDLDGLPDIWVANYEGETFALYRNNGNMTFTHVSRKLGVSALGALYVAWGTVFFDVDRDGDQDVFVSNGHVSRFPANAPLRQKALLLENLHGRRFVNVTAQAGDYLTKPHLGRGAAVGDIDNDGDLDLAICHTNEPVAILSNESKPRGDWISLRLIGTRSSRWPVGALVEVATTAGKQTGQLKGGTSYASSNDSRLFFGLGPSKIKTITIRWPSGLRQTLDNVKINRTVTVIEPQTGS